MGFIDNLFGWLDEEVDSATMEAVNAARETYRRYATRKLAFHLAVSYVADTMSKCEIKRFENGKPVKDNMYYLLNVSPNANQNATEFKYKLTSKLFKDGRALVFEEKGQLYVADSFLIDPHPLKGDKFTNISLDNETRTFERKVSDVFFFRLDDEELKGLVDAMLDDYSELLSHSFDVYKRSNPEKYVLELDETEAGDAEFVEQFNSMIKEQLEAFINNEKAVYPQFRGQKLTKISSDNVKTDSTDVRALRKEIFEATAEAFKMPVSMLYGNMTNAKDIVSIYVTFRIDPLAKMWSEEFTRKTVKSVEAYAAGTYTDVDTTRIMHFDVFENAANIEKLISSGYYCIDEVRARAGEYALNTDFSTQHWITKNFSPIQDVLNGEIDLMKGGE